MFHPLANLDVKIRSSYDYIIVLNSGDVPRVGQLAVARAFGDKSLKKHLSSEPDVSLEIVDEDTEFVILASDGIWKVGSSAPLHLPISMVHNLIFSF